MKRLTHNPEVITLETAGRYPYHIVSRVRINRRYTHYDEYGQFVPADSMSSHMITISKCTLCGINNPAEGELGGQCFGWFTVDKEFNRLLGEKQDGPTSSV